MPRVYRCGNGKIGVRYDLPGDPTGNVHGESWGLDSPLPDKPPRSCARCGNEFQPTVWRRLLCEYCYETADGGYDAASG